MSRYKSQVREVINRHSLVSLALDKGFNAYLPVYDGGIDFILYREADEKTGQESVLHKVQLKGRWTIDKKYRGRDLSIAVPIGEVWYLIPHDDMVALEMAEGVFETASWREKGIYSRGRPSKAIVAFCDPYRFGIVGEVVAAAVADEAAATEPAGPDVGESWFSPAIAERIAGSLLGGAVGDALGAAIEFLSLNEIRERFGFEGLRDYEPAYGRIGAITDDTQMTLFTAEGLIRARMRAESKGMCHPPSVIHHAYLRWLLTQGEHPNIGCDIIIEQNGWLWATKALHQRRAPGNTCLSALVAAEGWGAPERALNSKGCGGVMRVAPVGLFAQFVRDDAEVFELGVASAALTHGHPSGFLSAGYLAVTIAALVRGEDLEQALDAADLQLSDRDGSEEVSRAVLAARALARQGRPAPEAIESLGGGWVAEEALAIAICCALAAEDFEDGVLLAANHSGDSDSTAAIAGHILGAHLGAAEIPARLLDQLELRPEIDRLAGDLALAASGSQLSYDDYPPA